MPDYLQEFVTAEDYPDLAFQEWVHQVANKKMEHTIVSRAFGLLRYQHFGQR